MRLVAVKQKLIVSNAFSLNMLGDGTDAVKIDGVRVSKEQAEVYIREYLKQQKEIVNAIGHADLAAIVAQMFPDLPPAQRHDVILDADSALLVMQYRGPRLSEGCTKLPDGARLEIWVLCMQI